MDAKRSNIERMTAALELSGAEIQGDIVYVERLFDPKDTSEDKIGSLYYSNQGSNRNTINMHRPEFVQVIGVGKGYFDESTGEAEDIDLAPGNILQVGENTVRWFTRFGNVLEGKGQVGVMRAGENWIKFESLEKFNQFIEQFK